VYRRLDRRRAAARSANRETGCDVIALADNTAKIMLRFCHESGQAVEVQVNGQNLVRTSASLDAFEAIPV